MKKLNLIALIILLYKISYTQENFVFVSNNPYGNGISIRWVGEEALYKEGVNIYRTQNGKEWFKIKTVLPPTSLPEGLSEKQQNLFYTYLQTSPTEFKESFDIIFMLIESMKDYNYAHKIGIAYNDETAIKGNSYRYKIEGIVEGIPQELGITKEIICQDFTPKEAPQQFKLTRKRKSTQIHWYNNVNEYYSYRIDMRIEGESSWRSLEKDISSAGLTETKKKFYLEVPTNKDTTYEFRISAQDYFGKQSLTSQVYKLNIQDLDPPLAPSIRFEPNAKKLSIKISWDEPIDNDILGYNLYRSIVDIDSLYARVNDKLIGNTDTFYIDNLSRAGVYYYKLQVLDKAKNSTTTFPLSIEIFDVEPPTIPTNLVAIADTGKVILRWDKVTSADLKGYQLMRSVADDDNSDNLYVPVSPFFIDTNYYEEELSKNIRNPFIYVVKAVDSSLNISQASNEASAQLPDVIPPKAPFIKETYEENNAMAIKWIPNVESDLRGYNLFKRKKGDTAEFKQVNLLIIPSSLNIYIDKETKRGEFYEYRLQAVDQSSLVSEFSNDILAKLEYLELTGNINITKNKLNKNKHEVIIEWNTDSLLNEPIIGTSVYKSFEQNISIPVTKVTKETRFKEKIDKPGKYTYHIRVYGERGNVIKSENIEFDLD